MAKTQHRQVRMDDDLWEELGQLAEQLGTDRSAVLRDLARGWVKRARRRLQASA